MKEVKNKVESMRKKGVFIQLDRTEYINCISLGVEVDKVRGDDYDFIESSRGSDNDTSVTGFIGEKMVSSHYGSKYDDRVISDEEKEKKGLPPYDTIINDLRVDVKTAEYFPNVWLNVYPHELKPEVDVFVAVGVDVPDGHRFPNNKGVIAGWATKEEMREAPKRKWSESGGPSHRLTWKQIRRPETITEVDPQDIK